LSWLVCVFCTSGSSGALGRSGTHELLRGCELPAPCTGAAAGCWKPGGLLGCTPAGATAPGVAGEWWLRGPRSAAGWLRESKRERERKGEFAIAFACIGPVLYSCTRLIELPTPFQVMRWLAPQRAAHRARRYVHTLPHTQ
jgi:hypothetical protein